MPRERSPNRNKAFEIYKEHGGKIDLVEIAAMLKISDGTVRGWKNKDSWDAKLNGTFQKDKRNAPKEKNKKSSDKKEPEIEVVENNDLTDKQRLFCVYYVKYRNKTKAYMKAYQCSYENADAHAYELWENVGIRKEIDMRLKELRDEIKLDTQDVLQKYIDIAFADITDFLIFGQEEVPVMSAFGPVVDKEGQAVTKMVNAVKFRTWTNVDGTLISEISQGKDGAKLKLHDKVKALDFLAKHIGLLPEETKIKLRIEEERLKLEKIKVTGEGKGDSGSKVVIVDDIEGEEDGS